MYQYNVVTPDVGSLVKWALGEYCYAIAVLHEYETRFHEVKGLWNTCTIHGAQKAENELQDNTLSIKA